MRSKYLLLLLPVALVVVPGTRAQAPSATIEGKVTYTGTPPKMKPIDMSKEPICQKDHNPPELTQNVVTGPGNSLQYAVVYISAGEKAPKAPSEAVRFDQKGCMYTPHVLAVQAGQVLEIYSDDPLSHNIHPRPKLNPEWNRSQPAKSMPINTRWDTPEFIEVKCDIHPWMHGYIAVLNAAHYAVTDSTGSFSLKDLTPGTYGVTSWQEQYGTETQQVTVTAGETKAVNFSYKIAP